MRSNTERQICATCEYWTGARNPVFDAKGNPKIDICDNLGLCQNQFSRFLDASRKYDSKCVRYSKWTEIL